MHFFWSLLGGRLPERFPVPSLTGSTTCAHHIASTGGFRDGFHMDFPRPRIRNPSWHPYCWWSIGWIQMRSLRCYGYTWVIEHGWKNWRWRSWKRGTGIATLVYRRVYFGMDPRPPTWLHGDHRFSWRVLFRQNWAKHWLEMMNTMNMLQYFKEFPNDEIFV